MLQKLTVNKWIKLLILISIITYLYFVMRMVHLRGYDDDHVFLTIFHSGNVVEQLLYRFNSWSGRLAIEFIMLFTIGYSFFWKLGIGLSIIVLCFACCRISRLNPGIINIAFALILFAAIPAEINADASWWITGFYNYLLPVSVALYVFSVSFCMKKSIPEKIICIILAFYFPYMEQAGIAFIFAIICLIFARRKKVSYFDITILIIVLVNLIICLKAPGNERRFIL